MLKATQAAKLQRLRFLLSLFFENNKLRMFRFALSSIVLASLIACNANSPEIKYQLAEKLLEDKKYDAAIHEFQEVVDKLPSSTIGLDAQLKIAQIYQLYLGQPGEASTAYREFLKRNKDEVKKREIEKVLADLQFMNLENYGDAVQSYYKLLNDNPTHKEGEEILYKIGRSFFLRSRFVDAIKTFELLKGRFPTGDYFWKAELGIGHALSVQGKCRDAIKQYDKITLKAPKEQKVEALFSKAVCLEEEDDLDGAYEIFAGLKADYPAPSVVELKMLKIKKRKIVRQR